MEADGSEAGRAKEYQEAEFGDKGGQRPFLS